MDARPEAILYFTNSPFMGGMEAHIQHLAQGFARQGRCVGLICPSGASIAPLREACAAAGVRVHALPPATSPIGLAVRLVRLLCTMRRYRCGLLHLHMTGPYGGGLPILAGRLAGLRVVIRTEHQPSPSPPSRLQSLCIRLRDSFLARVICVSEATREHFTRDLGRNPALFVCIPNCIDVERFRPDVADGQAVRDDLGIAREATVVGMVSRLSEERKGGAQFVAMAARLASQVEGLHFLVVGEGELRPRLQEVARQAGVEVAITFAGARDDVPAVLAALDVFVVPSLWEGGPITLLEAMAMARAVVATRVGMVSEAVDDGVNGLIVPPGDVDALCAAVRSLAVDARRRAALGQAARRTASGRFSCQEMLRRTACLYTGVMAEHKANQRASGPKQSKKQRRCQ